VKFIDRFTRDDVSAKVWWPLALLAIIALVLTVPGANRAADDARADAASRAAELGTMEVRDSLSPTGVTSLQEKVRSSNATGATELLSLFAQDPVWSAVRVWSPEFTLWATSVPQERSEITSGEANNDSYLQAATADGSFRVVTDRLPTGGPGPTVFHAYSRIVGPAGGRYITDFEARDSVLLADVHREWLGYRIVVAVATLLLLGLAFMSMREPLAPIGTNVRFYPESLPANQTIVDFDRAFELDQADERIQDRISGLQERLDESERLRKKSEAQLQQALTALGSGGRSLTVPRPTGPEPDTKVEPQTPTRRRAVPQPTAPQPAPARPAAAEPKPVAASQPAPPARQQPAPARQQPTPARQQPAARQAPQPSAAPQPSVRRKKAAPPPAQPAAQAPAPFTKAPPPPLTAPAPAAKAPPPPPKRRAAGKHVPPAEPVTVASDDVSVTAGPPGSKVSDWPEVVVLPEPEKAPARKASGPDSDDEVLDVLNRLVPSSEEPHVLDDPGDLRARLARTAALKKPGSRERQEEREAASEGPAQQ
jgi:hypothetical protein